jgi:methylmalonyl-CoA mutase cobalamin-binding subunit
MRAMSPNMPPVLLAFAPADRFAAETVRDAFAKAGVGVDIAPQDGTARSAIAAAITIARVVVIVHSRAANGDAGMLRVAEAAAGRRLPMIVVRVDEAKPASGLRSFLRGAPSIDAAGGKLPQRVKGIVVRAKQAAGIPLGDAEEVDDGEGGIDIMSLDRPRLTPAWIAVGVVVLAAIGVLAWRGYERAATQSAFERGVAKLAAGDLDGAAADLDRALARRPDWADAWRQRGFASRDRTTMIASFSRAIALDPRDADALAARGRARFAGGDSVHAREDLSAALAIVPGNAEWHGERGLFAMSAGDDDAAARDFRECARLEPRCPEAFAARIAAVAAAQHKPARDWFASP